MARNKRSKPVQKTCILVWKESMIEIVWDLGDLAGGCRCFHRLQWLVL